MSLAEQIGRAMSDANKRHILTHQREMTFRELGEVAALQIDNLPADPPTAAKEGGDDSPVSALTPLDGERA